MVSGVRGYREGRLFVIFLNKGGAISSDPEPCLCVKLNYNILSIMTTKF